MIIKYIEATNGSGMNWGKFMVGRFDAVEWDMRSKVNEHRLLSDRGWAPHHIMVFDLQTGEGALFRPGGYAHNDLNKHQIWVCPLFEPFLEWLYKQDLTDLAKLPDHVDLPNAPSSVYGHRRSGPKKARKRKESRK